MPYKLTAKQWEAAKLIANGELASDVDRRLKLRHNTLFRWRRIPAFMEAVEQHVHELEDALTYKIRAMRYSSARRLCSKTESLAYNDPGEMLQMIKLLNIAEKFLDDELNDAELPMDANAMKEVDTKLQALE